MDGGPAQKHSLRPRNEGPTGVAQDLPQRPEARVLVRNVPLPLTARAPASGWGWPRGLESASRASERRRAAEGLEERASSLPVSGHTAHSARAFAPPAPASPVAPANRRTRGSARPGRGSGSHCACPEVMAGGGGGSRRRAARGGN